MFTYKPKTGKTTILRALYLKRWAIAALLGSALDGHAQGSASLQEATQVEASSTGHPVGTGSASLLHRAPDLPVYVEGNFGQERFDLQTLISKAFSPGGRGGFLSITSAQAGYNNNTNQFEFVNVTQISYNVGSGFSPTFGLALNRQVGASITAGLQYSFPRPNLLLGRAPSVFLTGSHDLQNVLAILYQPKVNKKLNFFGSLQVVDDYVVSTNLNVRSFAHSRIGLGHERLVFGVGSDLDWYGMPSDFRVNVGPFVGYTF